MNDRRRLIWLNGRLISSPLTDFWQISQTVQDPSIPNLPLTTPAGGAAAQTLTQSATYTNSNTFYTHTLSQAGGTQTLTQSATFENENAFFAHSLDQEDAISSSPPFIGRGGGGYLVELDAKPIRETITLYDEEAEILELLAAIMPVIHEQQQRRMTT